MARQHIRIIHKPTGTLLAEGPLGWGITPFEGNYYVSRGYLRTNGFRPNFIPGICPYNFYTSGWICTWRMAPRKEAWAGSTGCRSRFSPSSGVAWGCPVRIRLC